MEFFGLQDFSNSKLVIGENFTIKDEIYIVTSQDVKNQVVFPDSIVKVKTHLHPFPSRLEKLKKQD